jgi:hypothetical protein
MFAASDSEFNYVVALADETVVSQSDYERDELYDLVRNRSARASVEIKHIGLSSHNKRRLRERFAAELAPWAEARRAIFHLFIAFQNILGYMLSPA